MEVSRCVKRHISDGIVLLALHKNVAQTINVASGLAAEENYTVFLMRIVTYLFVIKKPGRQNASLSIIKMGVANNILSIYP